MSEANSVINKSTKEQLERVLSDQENELRAVRRRKKELLESVLDCEIREIEILRGIMDTREILEKIERGGM